MCIRGGLKAIAVKDKVIVLGGEDGLECEVNVDKGATRVYVKI